MSEFTSLAFANVAELCEELQFVGSRGIAVLKMNVFSGRRNVHACHLLQHFSDLQSFASSRFFVLCFLSM